METQFTIFAPLLKTSRDGDGRRRFHGVASSTIKDRHGDKINLSALGEMEQAARSNMTIFLNHSYEVPEDVAGTVERAMIKGHPDDPDIHDLALDVIVNEANPRAIAAWQAIEAGTQLGLSIGARIPEDGAKKNKDGRYEIDHIQLLEASLVGMPANPRSWVEYAVKSLRSQDLLIKELAGEGTQEEPVAVEEVVDEPATDAPAEEQPEAPDATEDDTTVLSADIDITSHTSPTTNNAAITFTPTPQGAPQSDPENGDEDHELILARGLTDVTNTLDTITRELIDTRTERDTAIKERDEAVALANKSLSDTAALLGRLAASPMGRKTIVPETQSHLDGLRSVYSDAFVDLLAKKE